MYYGSCYSGSGPGLRRFLLPLQQQPAVWSYYGGQGQPPNPPLLPFFLLVPKSTKPKPKTKGAAMRLKPAPPSTQPDPGPGANPDQTAEAEDGKTDIKKNKEKRKKEEVGGVELVVELVGAFNEVTQRMMSNSNNHNHNHNHVQALSTSSSRLLFQTLKLSIPTLLHHHHHHHHHHPHRSPLSKTLSVALLLADLQMDAEVISAGISREVVEAGPIALKDVRNQIGAPTAHLLYESLRVKKISAEAQVLDLDDKSAAAFRKYCLTYYDVRALILDLAVKLDTMRHDLHHLPRYQQQIFSLLVMRIHAPLAHAIGVGTNFLSLELEDLSFRYLFPHSYLYVDTWLSRNHETGLLDVYRDGLLRSLNADPLLSQMVDDISVEGRYKTRYSTMKKLLRDGRRPEQVNDILGLRVILRPTSGVDVPGLGERACYRTRKIIQSMWKEMPNRTKDYISTPKPNGYKSLHLAVDVSDNGSARPLMEIQIRTTEMDMLAAGGAASHSLYKGGLTDPEEVKPLAYSNPWL